MYNIGIIGSGLQADRRAQAVDQHIIICHFQKNK